MISGPTFRTVAAFMVAVVTGISASWLASLTAAHPSGITVIGLMVSLTSGFAIAPMLLAAGLKRIQSIAIWTILPMAALGVVAWAVLYEFAMRSGLAHFDDLLERELATEAVGVTCGTLFGFGAFAIAFASTGAHLVQSRWRIVTFALAAVLIALMAAVILVMPLD